MYVNATELFSKNKITQGKVTEITGLCRYTISKALSNRENPYFYIEDNKYFEISQSHPDLFPLPEDFRYYTKLSLMLNKHTNNISIAEFRNKCVQTSYFYSHDGYMYHLKDRMHATFPKFYLPYYKKDLAEDVWVYYESPYLPDAYKEPNICLRPITKEKAKKSDLIEFETYSLSNIVLNLHLNGIKQQSFFHAIEYSPYPYCNKEEISFVNHKQAIHQIFDPYIIPVCVLSGSTDPICTPCIVDSGFS